MLAPPKDVEPDRLFRLLCERRPQLPIDYRFSFSEDLPLFCRAPTPSEWRRAQDGADYVSAIVSASLCDVDGRPILSFDEAQLITPSDANELSRDLEHALGRCAPTYRRINADAWRAALKTGSEANWDINHALGGCYEIGGSRLIDRPDLYWGCPIGELNDGHWLVYRTARARYEETVTHE